MFRQAHMPALSLMVYSLSSFAALAACVLFAVATRVQFYPVMVFLGTSKAATAVLVNALLASTTLVGYGWVLLFLGRLRDAEIESVWDNMRFSVTETAFALTTFRDELNFRVGLLFVVLLYAKVFHLLNEARVLHIEQTQQTTRLSHIRTISLSLTLAIMDMLVINACARHVAEHGASVYLLFAFEHAVLLITLHTTIIRYGMAVYDLNYRGRWHNKSMYEMYVNLVGEALQFTAYLSFGTVVLIYYGIPIHLMRQLYVSFRNLVERMAHVVRFRRLVGDLNTRFPDATPEEIAATDGVCIICRDDMTEATAQVSGVPKKLACGHLFHSYCLQNWLERQFSCPTCRHPIPAEDAPRRPAAQAGVGAAMAAAGANAGAAAAAAFAQQLHQQPQAPPRAPLFGLPPPPGLGAQRPAPAPLQARRDDELPLPRRDEPPTPPMRPQAPNVAPGGAAAAAGAGDDAEHRNPPRSGGIVRGSGVPRRASPRAAAQTPVRDGTPGHDDDDEEGDDDEEETSAPAAAGASRPQQVSDEARRSAEPEVMFKSREELLRLQLRVFKLQIKAAKATEQAALAALMLEAGEEAKKTS